ncbi:histidine kinase [Roseofilum reptotaenium CS-1145]|uniref:Adaptive-response sensory-kinase SasA n=1 Tax=Roseofilum reptotaenium AO1-A TaxID=1925591 RepID=A0A1L9QX50_9CYAN|nr:histidine kinase [Roseofilum reptotaenium]MDB9519328.1 histidine kinase [Roseofilum reptotaenium CS-1145]OJJ27177.1 histidine kinase [Roseofilum reptotaenium AO1-A]
MQAAPEQPLKPDPPLQLLLFVDKRPYAGEQIRQIRCHIRNLAQDLDFELMVVDVSEQPQLAENFKVVATPALIKIHPQPKQTLAGGNLINLIDNWWPRWVQSVEEYVEQKELLHSDSCKLSSSIAHSAELIRLSDEIFRLRQETVELKEQLQFKDRIIAMLAHDLRNPLTAAALAVETLEIGYRADDGRASRFTATLTTQLLKHARTQIKAIDRMITDILQVAKGSNTQIQVHPEKIDLKPLFMRVLKNFDERLQYKSLNLETDVPQDLPLVYADSERIHQVMTNLLDNAIKYTPPKGSIKLSILHRTTQKIQVSLCDTGPGIPPEKQEKIFEDRFRLERDRTKEGYGIGLSLCQRIILAHYGQIWVESLDNQGSCFHFTLPVYRP